MNADPHNWRAVLNHLTRVEQLVRHARGTIIIGRQDRQGYAQPNLLDVAVRNLRARIHDVRLTLDGPGYERMANE